MVSVNLITWFGTLITGIVIAVVSALVTVHLALKRFYSEKWWERKAAAYAAIIEALHHVRDYAYTNLAFTQMGKDLPDIAAKELVSKMKPALAELRKQYDIGNFVISDKATQIIGVLFEELDKSTNTTDW